MNKYVKKRDGNSTRALLLVYPSTRFASDSDIVGKVDVLKREPSFQRSYLVQGSGYHNLPVVGENEGVKEGHFVGPHRYGTVRVQVGGHFILFHSVEGGREG